ncbi:MAG: tetratricopeptide repeat protein [Bacteroidales bacterium]|jgi:tetratricopeptide (TPR) repeat protein|nr:tetratricopeptide repeat protein [Bacteroidales bacterium]
MKRKIFSTIVVVFLVIIASGNVAIAQKNEVTKEPLQLLEDANAKFDDRNYATAYQLYADYITLYGKQQDLTTQRAYYRKAVAAAKMFNNDADKELLYFIESFADNTLKADAYIELADFYFQRNDFINAVVYYNKAETATLDKDKALEICYKRGYGYFQNGEMAKAQNDFTKVKDTKSKYASAATYFNCHILYEKGDYDKALSGFNSLRSDKNFGKIVPYYIAQIYYKQGNYENLIEIAQQLLSESDSKRNNELGYMLGDSFFKLKRYKEAIPYLKEAVDKDTLFDQNKNYELGYCLYKTDNYDEAIGYLKLINNNDSLTQNAYYYLGCCHLEKQDSQTARDYFRQASAMDFDKALKDDALFLYAKLCYQQPTPYNEAVDALQKYITQNSKGDKAKVQEARKMLAKIFATTKNYQQALELLEQIEMPDKELLEITQRTRLNRATELFNEKKDNEAMTLLDKCEKEPYDNQVTAAAYYLKSEILYRNNKFEEAEKYLNMFYTSSDVTKNTYYFKANYSMGYILFNQKKYAVAKDYFRRFLVNTSQEDPKRISDAHNRYADCLFMEKNYKEAIQQYDYAINENSLDVDYAYYQKALALGAINKTNEEISLLKDALVKFNNSNYAASMLFEIGNAYILLNDNQKALEYYEKQTKQYPTSIHTKESLGKTGMIYYKLNEDKKALDALDKLVKQYPGTEQAKAGLLQIRAIYVEQNRVDDFFNYVKNIPHTTISNDEQDSLLYQAAEARYMEADCNTAIKGFQDYIFRFPQGTFVTNAHYYLADCLMKNGQSQQALESYIAVCNASKNKFTHHSLLYSANIAYSLKQYDIAAEQYLRLDAESETNTHSLLAKMGRTRSLYNLKDYQKAIVCAKSTLEQTKLSTPERDEATYMLAQSYLALNDTTSALNEFTKLKNSSNGEYAGEANFVFAQDFFNRGNYDQSEKVIHTITANPSSEYWLAKAFILWGDIFHQRGNNLQAKQTYQSIIDNFEGGQLVNQAQQRLDNIILEENQAKTANEQSQQEAKEQVDEIIIDK